MTCPQTGYYAEIDFLTKPFFGGKPHKITGNIYRPCFKKPIMILKGEWNGVITAKPLSGDEFIFIDVKEKDEVKKVDLFVFFFFILCSCEVFNTDIFEIPLYGICVSLTAKSKGIAFEFLFLTLSLLLILDASFGLVCLIVIFVTGSADKTKKTPLNIYTVNNQ